MADKETTRTGSDGTRRYSNGDVSEGYYDKTGSWVETDRVPKKVWSSRSSKAGNPRSWSYIGKMPRKYSENYLSPAEVKRRAEEKKREAEKQREAKRRALMVLRKGNKYEESYKRKGGGTKYDSYGVTNGFKGAD